MEMIKKLNWRWLMMLAAVMMMGVTMTACGDDDDDDDNDGTGHPAEYVGVWADAAELAVGRTVVFAVKLDADGTGHDGKWDTQAAKFTVEDEAWNWRVDGSKFYLTYKDSNPVQGSFVISKDGKTGTMYVGNDAETFVKVK